MTGTEIGLITGFCSIAVGYVLGNIGRVSARECGLKHAGLDDTFNARFTAVEDRLKRIEGKLDRRLNGETKS